MSTLNAKLLILDVDGTMIPTGVHFHLVMRLLAIADKVESPTYEEYVKGFEPPYLLYLQKLGIKGTPDEIRDRVESTTSQFDFARYDDVGPTVSYMNRCNKIMCVVTANSEERVKRHLSDLPIRRLICRANDKASAISKICEDLFMKPERVAYVGDMGHDMAEAKKANVMAVGITRGNPTERVLRESGADHIVSDFYGVVKLVGI